MARPIDSLLVANRGEIACRIIRTARRLGIRTVAVFSDADAHALHVEMADEAVRIGPPPVAESYLDASRILEAARRTGADAIHPGYGFLSENPDFVEAVEAAGLTFVGPSASAIRAMGLKDAAKRLMQEAGVPVVPGYHGDSQDPEVLAAEAERIGFPVLIKARAGGGGKGMRAVERAADFAEALAAARREGEAAFGDPHCLIEKLIGTPRHIEIQVFGDSHGNAVHLFERDCSLQRRHQKVIEEAPAPGMTEEMRAAMGAAAVAAAKAIGYAGAGTIEFIVDASDGLRPDRFWFMEMNTRLQVEHPVTEAITGLDLVELQLRVAAGDPLPFSQQDLVIDGHAVEARIYAEDPARGFLPATGRLTTLRMPPESAGVRIDTGVREGDRITPHYDPMIAKLIVHGADRDAALRRLKAALAETRIAGCVTNVAFLERLAGDADFASGTVDTGLIGRHIDELTRPPQRRPEARAIAALAALGRLQAALARPSEAADPFRDLEGFRAFGAARQTARFSEADRGRVDVTVTTRGPGRYFVDGGGEADAAGVEITVLGAPAEAERDAPPHTSQNLSGGAVRLSVDGHRQTAFFACEADAVTVFLGAEPHRFEIFQPGAGEDDAVGGDQIAAPMPGLVKLVLAKIGDSVEKGAALIVLEAMKMEHTLRAPREATVEEILVAEGDQVEDGARLITLSEAPE